MAGRGRGSGSKNAGAGKARDAAAQTPPAPPALPRGRHGLSRVGREKALVLAARHTSFASPLLARAQMGLPSSPFVVPAFARRLRHHTTLPALPAIDPFSGQAGLSGALLRRYETFLSPWWERQPGAALRRDHLYTRMASASLAHRRRTARADAFEDAGRESTPPAPADAPVAMDMEPPALTQAAMQSAPAWEAGWDAPAWEAGHEPLASDAVTAVERAHALTTPLMPAIYREPLSLSSLRPASDLLMSPLAAALAPPSPAAAGGGEEAASTIARAPEPHTAHAAHAQEWRQRFYGWEQWQPTFMPAGPLPLAVSQEMPDASGEEGAAEETEPDGFARSDGTPALPPAPFAPPMTALPGVFGLLSSIQRRARDGAGTPGADQRARALAYAGQSTGGPLDAASAVLMRATLGSRFEGVRVHADAAAAQAAAALGAHAFTVGQNVYFAEGAYTPETPAGLALLGHELAHTLQQGAMFAVPAGLPPDQSAGEAMGSAAALPVPSALQRSALPLALAALPSGPDLVSSLPSDYGSVSPSDYGSVSSLSGGGVAAPPAFQSGAAAFASGPAPLPAMIGSGAGVGRPSLPLSLAADLAVRDDAPVDRSAARMGGGATPYAPYPLFAGAMTHAAGQRTGSTGLPQTVPGSSLAAMSLSLMASRAASEAPLAGTAGVSLGAGAPPMALITATLSPWVSAAARLSGYGASPLGGYGASASPAAPAGPFAEGYGYASAMAAALPGAAMSASAMETSAVERQVQADLAQPPATTQAGEQAAPAMISPSVAPYAALLPMSFTEGRIPLPPSEGGMPSAFGDGRMPAAGALPSPAAAGMFGIAGLAAEADGAQAAAASALAGHGTVPGGVLQLMRAAMAEQASNERGPGATSGFATRPGDSSSFSVGTGTAAITMRPGMTSISPVPALEAGPAALLGRTRGDGAATGSAAPSPLSLALAAGSLGISSGIIARQIAGALTRGMSGLRDGMAPDGGAFAANAGEAFGYGPQSQAGPLAEPSRVPGGTSPQGTVPAQTGQWYPGALRVPDAALPQGAVSYEGAMGVGSMGAAEAARVSGQAPRAASWPSDADAAVARMVRPLDLAGSILARAAGSDATAIAPAALAARADLWSGADALARDPLSRPAVLSRAPLAITLAGIAPSIDRGVAGTSAAGSFMSPPSAPDATLAEPFRPIMRDMLASVAPVDVASGEAGHGDRAGAASPSRALLPAAGSVVSGLAALVDGGIGRVARFARTLVQGESAEMERATALAPAASLAADTPTPTIIGSAAATGIGSHGVAAMMVGTPVPGALALDALTTPAVMPVQRAVPEAVQGMETGTAMGIIGRGAVLVDALVSRASGVLSLAGEAGAPRPALALSFADGPAAPGASAGPGRSGGPSASGASMAAGLSRVGALATSIQRKAERGAETPSLQRRVTALERVAESSGQPLGGTTREVMRAALGRDVGTVQVHTDAAAARAADILGARAFALGRSVYFASGAYAPETPAGLALLGHELVHTMQGYGGAQRAAAAGAPTLDAAAEPAHLEAEALRTEESLLHLFSAGPPSMLAASGVAASGVGSAPDAVQRATLTGAVPSMALFAPAIPVVSTMTAGPATLGSAPAALLAATTGGLAASAMALGTSGAVQRVPDGAAPLRPNASGPVTWPRASQESSLGAAFAFNTVAMLPGYAALQRRFDAGFEAGATALTGAPSDASWVARFAGASLPEASGATGATMAGVGDATGVSTGAYGNTTAANYETYGNATLAGGTPYGSLSPSILSGFTAGVSGGAPAGMAMALSGASSGIPVMRAVDGAAQPGGRPLSAAPLDMGMRLMRLSIQAGDMATVPGASAGFAPVDSSVYQRAVDGGALDGSSYQSGIGVTAGDAGRPLGALGMDMSLAGTGSLALGMGTGISIGAGTGATLGMSMGIGTPPVQRDVDGIVQRDVDGMRTLANPGLTSAMNDESAGDVGLTNAATADRALRERMVTAADGTPDASAWGDSIERTLAGHASASNDLAGMLQRRVDHPDDGVESLAVDAVPMTQRTTPVVVARSADSGVSQGISSGDSWAGTPGESWTGTGGGSWPGAMPAPLGGSNGAVVQRFVPDTSTASGGHDVKTSATGAQDTHGATGSGAQAAPNIDELTEQVIRRIKQQLRLDQERMGGYLPDFMR